MDDNNNRVRESYLVRGMMMTTTDHLSDFTRVFIMEERTRKGRNNSFVVLPLLTCTQ